MHEIDFIPDQICFAFRREASCFYRWQRQPIQILLSTKKYHSFGSSFLYERFLALLRY
jgi:hypothetical protein